MALPDPRPGPPWSRIVESRSQADCVEAGRTRCNVDKCPDEIYHESRDPRLMPLADRGPLRVMFVTHVDAGRRRRNLLVNLVRRLDRNQFLPELCCLKELGPLGEELAEEIPAFSDMLSHKTDLRVFCRG